VFVVKVAFGVFSLALGACWIFFDSDYRFDVYFGVSSFVFGMLFIRDWHPTPEALTPHDVALFREFRSLFADAGYIQAYRDHDFLSYFRKSYLEPLFTVTQTWDDAAHSFTNKALEAKRLDFVRAASLLGIRISTNTIPTDDMQFVTVIPRGIDPEALPTWVKQDAKAIHDLIPGFVDTHEDLLKCGNQLRISR
jgi:hypothetical protein